MNSHQIFVVPWVLYLHIATIKYTVDLFIHDILRSAQQFRLVANLRAMLPRYIVAVRMSWIDQVGLFLSLLVVERSTPPVWCWSWTFLFDSTFNDIQWFLLRYSTELPWATLVTSELCPALCWSCHSEFSRGQTVTYANDLSKWVWYVKHGQYSKANCGR